MIRVVCFGELALHVTVEPDLRAGDRPGFRIAPVSFDAGGSPAYVARQLVSMDAVEVQVVALVGRDRPGRWVEDLLADRIGDAASLRVVRDAPRTARVLVNAGDGEPALTATPSGADLDVLAEYASLAEGAHYAHLTCFPGSDRLRAALVATGTPLVADFGYLPWRWPGVLAGEVLSRLDGVAVAILNGRDGRQETLEVASRCVARGVPLVVVTLAEDGALLCDTAGVRHQPAVPVKTRDPVGAGDTMTAALLVGLARGMPPDRALALGQREAALKVARSPGGE